MLTTRGRETDVYQYKVVEVVKVIDGDTIDLRISLGFGITGTLRIRLYGIDTPETFGVHAEGVRGPAATSFTRAWLQERAERLQIETFKGSAATVGIGDGSFGRWLGALSDRETAEDLGQALRDAGHVK